MKELEKVKKNSIKPQAFQIFASNLAKQGYTIRSSLRLHNQSLIKENKDNPKTIWRTINKVLDKAPNSTTIMQMRDDSKATSDSKRIASALNSHSVNVGPRLANRIEVKSGGDPLCYLHNRQKKQSSSSNM